MTTTDDLRDFVKEALTRGTTRSGVEAALTGAGWSATRVRGALNEFADVEFPIPVPRPRPSLDARDAFLYLVLFSTLYISASHLGSLTFELIDRLFPDPAFTRPNQAAMAADVIRWSLASLIVSTPVFLFVSSRVGRAIRLDPAKRGSTVRRWLSYLTLSVASATLIGDVILLVFNLLSGELTVRFLLKVLTVAVIAGGGFLYYLRQLKADEKGTDRP